MRDFDQDQETGPARDSALPDRVTIMEVGPRDGLQFEKKILPTPLKVQLITDLVAAGLKEIQVASFVNPDRVPQMADADTLVAKLPAKTGVVYNGLVLNLKGVQRAAAAGNIATEDLVNLLNTLHINTHIDIKKLARCSRKLETFFEKRFSGRMYRMVV